MNGTDEIGAPEHFTPSHEVDAFDSGVPALDDWLKRRALDNEKTHASRTYVVVAGGRVVGYYALANGAVALSQAPGRARRNMPDPIPVMVMGRLAVDRLHQGRGIGQGLLKDAVLRTIQAAEIAGIRAILVHAISDDARRFYLRHGFIECPIAPMTLLLTLADAERALRGGK